MEQPGIRGGEVPVAVIQSRPAQKLPGTVQISWGRCWGSVQWIGIYLIVRHNWPKYLISQNIVVDGLFNIIFILAHYIWTQRVREQNIPTTFLEWSLKFEYHADVILSIMSVWKYHVCVIVSHRRGLTLKYMSDHYLYCKALIEGIWIIPSDIIFNQSNSCYWTRTGMHCTLDY